MKKCWSFVFLTVLLLGLIFSPSLAFMDEVGGNKEEVDAINKEIEARKQKIQELENSIAEYNKNINKKQSEASSLKNQLSILDNRTAQIEAQIDLTRTKLEETQLEIDSLNITIKDKQETIDRQKKIITTLLLHLNAEGEKKYIEVLLTNKNFADFFDQVKYLEKVNIDLGESVKALRLAKADLDLRMNQVETRKIEYSTLKEQLENQRDDLAEQTNAKQNLLVQTQSSEHKYRTMVSSLRQQYQSVENELKSYEEQAQKKLEAQNKIPKSGNVPFIWPVPSHYITAAFHDADYPFRNVFEHQAIDLRAAQGTPVMATASGYVGKVTHCTTASCYNYVLIVHTGNISTVYGHLSKIYVTTDQYVKQGDIIGLSGATPGTVGAGPFVTGPHLHFEVRLNGIPTNPVPYLP